MEGDIIAEHGNFRIVQGPHAHTFKAFCKRYGKENFRIIFEHGQLSDLRDGGKMKDWVPHLATWVQNTLLARADKMKLDSQMGQNHDHAI